MMDTDLVYLPVVLRLNNPADKKIYEDILKDKNTQIHNEIYTQLQELIKCQNPSIKIKDYSQTILDHLNGENIDHYGVWVYYSWRKKLIHILDNEEFIKVRTNRNKHKITTLEQQELSNKKIGIVGLSVGQSIALTMIIERICGEIRLADFDTLELSNLNRIRAPLYSLGLKKTIIAAREISEIDPFISVKVFNKGLNNDDMDAFFLKDGKLDLLVEVCDDLNIKIQSRYKARELKIPVVMDTNDRGMLDIERFDLEPSRVIFHGLIGDTDILVQNLSQEEKTSIIYKIVNLNNTSPKLKLSISEIGKSINTWPQLAKSTMLGGAMTTDISRKILLNQHNNSGRYYLDFDELIL